MLRRRRAEGSNLAFLDVMACGLGATILLFLVIKHNVETKRESPVVEEQRRDAELKTLRDQKQSLEEQKKSLEEQQRSLEEQIVEALKRKAKQTVAEAKEESQSASSQAAAAALQKEIDQLRQRNAALKKAVENIEVKETADVIEDSSVGEEEYLLGLQVEGKRIAILVDHSASMTDERLVDIITRKLRSDAQKKAGPKWKRTQKTVRWILNRVPEGSQVSVIAFSDQARQLGPGGWLQGGKTDQINKLVRDLGSLLPSGATNFQEGLAELGKLRPAVTDLYLVTDGLPTQAKAKFQFGSGCSRRKETISGDCRVRMFWNSLAAAGPRLSNTRVNVVLLPLEGDPFAAYEYGIWTSVTGGLLLGPAPSWP